MNTITTSISIFKGFNSNVTTTKNWFTQNKSVDLTDYIYGKQKFNVVKKTFNMIDWMLKIASIKRNINRLYKSVKFIKKIAKFGIKISRALFKLIRKIVKLGIEWFGKPILKISKIIGKGIFKGFKFALDLILTPIKKIGVFAMRLAKKIVLSVYQFIYKKIIKPVKDLIMGSLRRIKAIITPFLKSFWQVLKSGFNKIKNLVVSKGTCIFNAGKTTIIKTKQNTKGIIGGTIKWFKTGTSKVITKIIGLGKAAKNLILVTKDGIIAKGKSAIDWLSHTKKYWITGLKFLKHKAKMKWWKFTKFNKVGKIGVATFKWIMKLIKCLLALCKVLKNIIKPIVSAVAAVAAPETFGLALLIPLIIGLIIEGITYAPELIYHLANGNLFSYLLTVGRCIISVLGWINTPAAIADLLISLGELGAYQMVWTWLKWNINGYRFDDEILPSKSSSDIIFTHDTAYQIDTIKDLQNHIITSYILTVKQHTDKFNSTAIKLIRLVTEKQILRSNYLNQCVNAI